jgi:hypothetical protein
MRSFLSLAALLLALAPAARAQAASAPTDTWLFVRFANGALAWNLDKVRWNAAGDTVEGESLVHLQPPSIIEGKEIVWAHEFFRIACKANTYELTWGEELNSGLGQAFELTPGPASPIADGTTEHLLKRLYCDNVTFAGVGEAKGMLGLIEAVLGRDPLARQP